jgi:hypothetical protein
VLRTSLTTRRDQPEGLHPAATPASAESATLSYTGTEPDWMTEVLPASVDAPRERDNDPECKRGATRFVASSSQGRRLDRVVESDSLVIAASAVIRTAAEEFDLHERASAHLGLCGRPVEGHFCPDN